DRHCLDTGTRNDPDIQPFPGARIDKPGIRGMWQWLTKNCCLNLRPPNLAGLEMEWLDKRAALKPFPKLQRFFVPLLEKEHLHEAPAEITYFTSPVLPVRFLLQ